MNRYTLKSILIIICFMIVTNSITYACDQYPLADIDIYPEADTLYRAIWDTEPIVFDGSNSYDPDNGNYPGAGITSYEWWIWGWLYDNSVYDDVMMDSGPSLTTFNFYPSYYANLYELHPGLYEIEHFVVGDDSYPGYFDYSEYPYYWDHRYLYLIDSYSYPDEYYIMQGTGTDLNYNMDIAGLSYDVAWVYLRNEDGYICVSYNVNNLSGTISWNGISNYSRSPYYGQYLPPGIYYLCIEIVIGGTIINNSQVTEEIITVVADVDLDTDINGDATIDEENDDDPYETDPGGYIAVNGNRKFIKMKVEPFNVNVDYDNIIVSVDITQGGDKTDIYSASTGGYNFGDGKYWYLDSYYDRVALNYYMNSLYIQATDASTGLHDIEITLTYYDSYSCTVLDDDTVNFTAIKADLDIDGTNETTEDDPGGLVVRNYNGNNAPRKKIILNQLQPTVWSGNLLLTRNNTNVKVYDAQSGGTEITFNGTDNKFANSSLTTPKNLWVEGSNASSSMRDVTLTLTVEGIIPTIKDEVKFTVLWVTITAKYASETLSVDNDKRDYIKNNVQVPSDYDLGEHLALVNDGKAWWSYAEEFKGDVIPSNFNPAEFGESLHFARSKTSLGYYYYGPNGSENSFTSPAGDDTSYDVYRDDNPSPSGNIYDFDNPGLDLFYLYVANTIFRQRANYKQWATWGSVRCSEELMWYTAKSMKKTGVSDTGTATSCGANTLTDTTKSWTANTWKFIKITGGTGLDQIRLITGNTSNTITIRENWETPPDNTSQYSLIQSTTWIKETGVSNDNQTGNGQLTKLTWNLQ